MKKVLKILGALLVLVIGAGLAIGFAHDAKFDQREVVIVNAPVEKVYALVGDPRNVSKWLPKSAGDIESTEMLGSGVLEKAAGAAIDKALGGGSAAGTMTPTHVYHLRGGKRMEMQIVSRKKDEEFLERMVGGDSGFEKMVSDITWGFDMAPADGDSTKTKLTVVSRGEAKKPLGNLIFAIGQMMGEAHKHAVEMGDNIEKALK
jgi:hypothetical protein